MVGILSAKRMVNGVLGETVIWKQDTATTNDQGETTSETALIRDFKVIVYVPKENPAIRTPLEEGERLDGTIKLMVPTKDHEAVRLNVKIQDTISWRDNAYIVTEIVDFATNGHIEVTARLQSLTSDD